MTKVVNSKHRLGIIAIILKNPSASVMGLNEMLHQYSHLIVGRMGIPYKERNLSVMSIIIDGTNDEIGALTGKIGQLPGVSVKTVLTKV